MPPFFFFTLPPPQTIKFQHGIEEDHLATLKGPSCVSIRYQFTYLFIRFLMGGLTGVGNGCRMVE